MTDLYQEILNRLLASQEPISGQLLADQLHASRNAIWKNIEKLRSEGYNIQTVHKAGYLLTKPSPHLDASQIAAQLDNAWKDLTIQTHEQVTSTNDLAKQYAIQHHNHSVLMVASKQTQGRGRRGRQFHSLLDHGLYLSLHIQPDIQQIEDITFYTLATATAMSQALSPYLEEELAIKWVNDLFYRGRKVAGILCEASSDLETGSISGVTIGIGLNLAGDFSQADTQTQQVAGTLFAKALPEDFNPNQLIVDFLNRFVLFHKNLSQRDFLEYYSQHLLGINKEVTYRENSQTKKGIIRGINPQGHLLIEQADGQLHNLFSQEIHFSSQQFIQEDH